MSTPAIRTELAVCRYCFRTDESCCSNILLQYNRVFGIFTYQNNPSNPLEELEKYCSHTAAFDSATRFNPLQCAESTRLQIIQNLEEWTNVSPGCTAVPRQGNLRLHNHSPRNSRRRSWHFLFQKKKRSNKEQRRSTLVVGSFEGFAPFVEVFQLVSHDQQFVSPIVGPINFIRF